MVACVVRRASRHDACSRPVKIKRKKSTIFLLTILRLDVWIFAIIILYFLKKFFSLVYLFLFIIFYSFIHLIIIIIIQNTNELTRRSREAHARARLDDDGVSPRTDYSTFPYRPRERVPGRV